MIQFIFSLSKSSYQYIAIAIIIMIELFFGGLSWDLYLNHYPQRALVTRAWQCGYKELSNYIKNNYDKYDSFYITKKHGQPYIFLLFYQQYDPGTYQKQAQLSKPDEYGFGQVEQFDKFIFSTSIPKPQRGSYAVIGYPDDFSLSSKIPYQKIKQGTEEIFWIQEFK